MLRPSRISSFSRPLYLSESQADYGRHFQGPLRLQITISNVPAERLHSPTAVAESAGETVSSGASCLATTGLQLRVFRAVPLTSLEILSSELRTAHQR